MGVNYYEAAVRSGATTNNAAVVTIHTGANLRAYITEIGVAINAATQSGFFLVRPNNSPVASTSLIGAAIDPQSPVATVNVDTAWSTAPTLAGTPPYMRRFQLPASAGSGFAWAWSETSPLIVAVSSYLVLWNAVGSTNSAADVYVKWYEGN